MSDLVFRFEHLKVWTGGQLANPLLAFIWQHGFGQPHVTDDASKARLEITEHYNHIFLESLSFEKGPEQSFCTPGLQSFCRSSPFAVLLKRGLPSL